jgi:magnesium-transporting ATPase (P-type)
VTAGGAAVNPDPPRTDAGAGWTAAVLAEHGWHGLAPAEAVDRLARGQGNRTPRSDWADYRAILARNLFTLFNALVVPAAVALFWLHEYRGAWAVSGMAVVNTLLGLAQEVRAKRHLERLAILTETRARVVRGGTVCTLPAGDVVLDDLLLLGAGEPVVADGPVLAAHYLEVDEALLTGESDPVPRRPGERLLSGSYAVAGEAVYRADRVGGAAFANETSLQARQYLHVASPVQRAINLLIGILSATAVVLCGLYGVLYLVRGFPLTDLVEMAAATVTSMVPQGLVLMTTLAFILAAVRLSGRGAVVQRLEAVESMAAVDVLCMDKTGTLTSNRLRLDRLVVLDEADGKEAVRELLRAFAWGSVDAGNKSIQALRSGLGGPPLPGSVALLDQLPFKSQNRYSAVRVRAGPTERVLVLGACEALRPFLEEEGCWEAAWRELLPTGLRLLLFAEAPGGGGPPLGTALADVRLRPLALVALSDELRPEAGLVLEALAAQGIAFKVLSGDSPETVRATVGRLRLPLARELVVSGDELAAAPDRAGLIEARSVFGRVAPRQKVEIVAVLRGHGRRVAMIGDGVNDVLPIKRADLGIAMGAGSAAARTVAGLVLETDDFGLLPETLNEGRNILRNLRRAGKLFLLKNVYTLFLIVAALGVFRLAFPYLPQQVTLLNFLTIGVPAFLIMLTRERSAAASGPGFLREIGWFAVVTGLITGVAGLVLFLLSAWGRGDPVETQRTLLLALLVLMGLGNLWRVLGHGEGRAPTGDRLLRLWPAAALALFALAMYLGPVADFFWLTPLTGAEWGLVLAVAAPALAACVLTDRLPEFRRSPSSTPAGLPGR